MSEIKTFEELVEFFKNRYSNYDIVEYPEVESVTEAEPYMLENGEVGARPIEVANHIYDNLGFVNRKTKVEEVTLPNMGFNSFQGFSSTEEIIEFLDNKLIKECEDEK